MWLGFVPAAQAARPAALGYYRAWAMRNSLTPCSPAMLISTESRRISKQRILIFCSFRLAGLVGHDDHDVA